MSLFTLPSSATEGSTCASDHTHFDRFRAPIAMIIAALMLIGSLGMATPAAAIELLPGPGSEQAVPPAEASSTGDAIAGFAMQFLGYPYVWAGNTPAGFDCSGFTQYVVLSTVGIDIGHGTAGQTAYGTPVAWGAWQPGDLVYFANTFSAGISHAGIYIGDGQMIHAENASTGVTISSIYSDYYSAHYYGAFRIG
ncbi:MAG TPA: C40 family peptidase [Thermomicrobiales bacterium]|nr:C40 family peptidase [Thermomicrobiales bacterium]